MDLRDNINTVKEIFPGQFQIILNFATIKFLPYALSDEYKYVWVYSSEINSALEWQTYKLPLFDSQGYHEVLARGISFEFIVPTDQFKNLLPQIGPGITLAQLNVPPPNYLRPEEIRGKLRYDLLLKECDYLFEINIPSATDYGTIISSNKEFLHRLLHNKEIDWNNLP